MKIDLMTNPRLPWPRMLLSTAVQTIPISIGIWTGSPAMQWMGFVSALLVLIGMASILVRRDQGLTIAQARARLDEIEAEEAK